MHSDTQRLIEAVPSATQVDDTLSMPRPKVAEALAAIDGKILVLGAGGKMGLHVTRMIHAADQMNGTAQRVTAVSRFSSVHGREAFEHQGIPIIACDLEDDVALEALPDVPNIVFMAGAKFGTDRQPDLLERMNVRLPRRVAERFAGARCLVFSTGCVYAMVEPGTGGSRETGPTDPPGAYAQSCLKREEAFARTAHEFGSPIALIRLNYATEFRYGVLVDIAQKVMTGESIDLSMGFVNLIWQRDAVDHILQAFPLANTEPFVLNVTGPEALSVRSLAERFGHFLGREPNFTGEAQATAWLNNPAKSHKLFGQPETSLDQMIAWTAGWLLRGEGTFGKPTGFSNREGTF